MATGRRLYSTGRTDLLFSVLFLLGIGLVAKAPTQIFSPDGGTWGEVALALGATALLTLLTLWGSRFDRRCAEDYAFQMMAHAAFVAIPATLLVHALWNFRLLNRAGLSTPTSGDIVGVMLISWAVAYAGYRIKGLNP